MVNVTGYGAADLNRFFFAFIEAALLTSSATNNDFRCRSRPSQQKQKRFSRVARFFSSLS